MLKEWLNNYTNTQNKSVVIIGAGISGAYTAYYLAQHGYEVSVIDKSSDIAQGASGNPQAILYYSSSGREEYLDEMFKIGYQNSSHLIKQLLTPDIDYQHSGSIHIASNPRLVKQHKNILQKNLTNFKCIHNDLDIIRNEYSTYLMDKQSIWLKPLALIRKLLNHPNINVITNTQASKLSFVNQIWQVLLDNERILTTGNIVICTGFELDSFEQVSELPIIPNSGQISLIKKFTPLDKILCFGGYLTPAIDGYHCLGATYHPNQIKTKISLEDHKLNLEQLNDILATPLQIDLNLIHGRVATRGTTRDYYPMIGPVTTYQLFKEKYHRLGYNPKQRIDIPCPYLPGLYLNLGHGSKGMLSSSFAGELISQYITNQTINCTNQLREKVHPNRFWLKRIIHENNTTH